MYLSGWNLACHVGNPGSIPGISCLVYVRFGLLSFLRFPKSRQFQGLNTNLELPFINLVVKREML